MAAFLDAAADIAQIESEWRLHVVSVAIFVATAVLMTRPGGVPKLRAEFSAERFPVNVIPVLEQHGMGRVFTRDQWADYLIYRMYPSMQVYFDGRSDFYGNDFVNEYSKVMAASTGWDKVLDRYAVDRALLPVDEALAAVMKATPGWRVVYDDHKAILFERTAARTVQVLADREVGRNDCDCRIKPYHGSPVMASTQSGARITTKPM